MASGAYKSSEGRQAIVESPLGSDVFRFRSLHAVEGLSTPFEIQIVVTSEKTDISFDKIGGQLMNIRLYTEEGNERFYSGYVSKMSRVLGVESAGKRHVNEYQIQLVPWLWFLTQRSDCRIFNGLDGSVQNSVVDIIKKVVQEAGFASSLDVNSLEEKYPSLDYVVQFNETDFQFVSRLMEREGIYYYFEHTSSGHNMILADSDSAHGVYEKYDEIPFAGEQEDAGNEHFRDWSCSCSVRSGGFVQRDYDYLEPPKNLESTQKESGDYAQAKHERYEYPGRYIVKKEGDRYTRVRLEQARHGNEIVTGRGDALGVVPGYRFKLIDSPDRSQNREYLVFASEATAKAAEEDKTAEGIVEVPKFSVTMSGIVATDKFRPPRVTPIPRVAGPQLAVVLGQDGEEITTDEHGRIKIGFFWDRSGVMNQDASCWVRVSQALAHGVWGAQFLPRHGQEVIVEYVDGDIDLPLVTGAVYNGTNKVPFKLPDNKTQSGLRTHSTKDGTADNFNELRFEDLIEKEEIYFHAEKDFNRVVENNDTLKVGFEKMDAGDQTIEIYNDRTKIIGNNEIVKIGGDIKDAGDQTIGIHNNRTVTLSEGNDTLTIDKGNREATVTKGDDTVTIAAGSRTVDVAKKILIKAGDEITLETGSAKIVMKKDGTIDITGKDITIKGTGNIKLTATGNLDAKGMATKVEGTTVEVKASGNLTLKGAMTAIN